MISQTRIAVILLMLVALCSCGQSGKKEATDENQKPNILFIMADDHAVNAISAYKSNIADLAPTPNIDRIANNGALFTSTYCTNSICGPSRAVILTGKFSHQNGFRMNGDRFDGSQPTLPKMLKKLGYTTAMIGKWHLYGYPQGFDYWNMIEDQGHYYNPDFITMEGDTVRIPGYATDIITDEAIDWLDKGRDKTKPFFMMLHHKAPHRNWMPALRYVHAFDNVTFPVPDSFFDDHAGQPGAQSQLQTIATDMYEGHDLKLSKEYGSTELHVNPWANDFQRMDSVQRKAWDEAYLPKNNAFWKADLHGKDLAIWKYQRYMQDYLATVKAVDEGVGKVLDYLRDNDLMDNTIVVYTSDQGFYLGEKGYFDKRYMYEESFRMPFMIQYPGHIKAGTTVDALTQNVDFAETFLDYAGGMEYTKDMQGKSFRPVLEGKVSDEDFRDALYYHYYDFPAFHMVKRHYGIKTKRYKLMHFYDDIDAWEFYDLEKDPKEENNAINDASYAETIAKLKVRLKELQAEYEVSESEMTKTTDPKRVENAYKQFDRMRHIGGDPLK